MNLDIYNALKQPPKDALKQIGAGRLKGMSDINPQWRFEAMTAQFGAVGIGWRYSIDRLWNEPANADQVFAFALVSIYIKEGEDWSSPIPGIGGSMLITKEREGLHASDEGYKMAVTDALSVAMKALGVGADIYRGRFDGSKYRDEVIAPNPDKETVKEYASEMKRLDQQQADTSADDMRKEMESWFLKQYGADAMGEFSKMTNNAFKDPASIKLDKNVRLAYAKFLEFKEGK